MGADAGHLKEDRLPRPAKGYARQSEVFLPQITRINTDKKMEDQMMKRLTIVLIGLLGIGLAGCRSTKPIDLTALNTQADTGVISQEGDIRGIQDFDAATRGATMYVKDEEGRLFYLRGVSPASVSVRR